MQMLGRRWDTTMLLGLSLLWSTGYILISIADESLPPITLTAVRAWLAALVLLVVCLVTRRRLRQAKPWHRAYLAPTFLIASFPWVLTAEGEHFIDAGLTSLMTSLTPISTFAIVALVLRAEKAGGLRICGMLISFVGLAMAIGFKSLLHGDLSWFGLALVATAFTMYGVNGILLARWAGGLDPLVTSFVAIAYAAVLLTGAAFAVEQPWLIDPKAASLEAVTVLGTIVTAGGYALYFMLVQRAGSLFASTWGYLVPALGVVLSALWLHTPMGFSRLAGTALVIGGIVLVNRRGKGEEIAAKK